MVLFEPGSRFLSVKGICVVHVQDKSDFVQSTLPSLLPVFSSAHGDTLLLLVKHAALLINKASALCDLLIYHLTGLFYCIVLLRFLHPVFITWLYASSPLDFFLTSVMLSSIFLNIQL